MTESLTGIVVLAAGVSGSLWLEKQHPTFSRLSASLIVIVLGYLASVTNIASISSSTYAAVIQVILPVSLVCALLSTLDSSFSIFRRLLRSPLWIMVMGLVIAAALSFILVNVGANKVSLVSEFRSPIDAFVSVITPKTLTNLKHPQESLIEQIATTTIVLSTIMVLVIAILLRNYFRTIWLYVPIEEAARRHINERVRYSERSGQTTPWNLLMGFSIATTLVLVANSLHSVLPLIPTTLLLLTVSLAARSIVSYGGLTSAFLALSTIGTHVFLFCIGTILATSPWSMLKPQTFLFITIVTVTQLIIILAIGKRAGLDIETICTLFLALVGGPTVAATLAAAKKWDPLLPGAFLFGLVAQGLTWAICLLL